MHRKLFSWAVNESEYFNDRQDKIELESCPRGSEGCIELLSAINTCFRDSSIYHRNKDYPRSIDALKRAFEKSKEIHETSCLNCARFFRITITQSLENIHTDLGKMATGKFRFKRFKKNYKQSTLVLEDFLKEC